MCNHIQRFKNFQIRLSWKRQSPLPKNLNVPPKQQILKLRQQLFNGQIQIFLYQKYNNLIYMCKLSFTSNKGFTKVTSKTKND